MEQTRKDTKIISGVVFDFDGTITTPGHLDFAAIRRAIGCPDGVSILTYIEDLPLSERAEAERVLDEFEMRAAAEIGPASGLAELIAYLNDHSLKRGILTRNTLRAVERSIENLPFVRLEDFSCVITRDDDIPVKPEPAGVIAAASQFGVAPNELMVVGDYLYDIEAGRNAGAVTVFVDNLPSRGFAAPDADFTIADLRSLIPILHSHSAVSLTGG